MFEVLEMRVRTSVYSPEIFEGRLDYSSRTLERLVLGGVDVELRRAR